MVNYNESGNFEKLLIFTLKMMNDLSMVICENFVVAIKKLLVNLKKIAILKGKRWKLKPNKWKTGKHWLQISSSIFVWVRLETNFRNLSTRSSEKNFKIEKNSWITQQKEISSKLIQRNLIADTSFLLPSLGERKNINKNFRSQGALTKKGSKVE